uniref:G-protein coupled receptors family 3 profile domain-containing protein n=1 Tax=Pygocentrus nattereri TaxID=42514 RepID=A0AAR2LFX2_PYGNA
MAAFTEAAEQLGICLEYSLPFFRTYSQEKVLRMIQQIKSSTSRVIVGFLDTWDLEILVHVFFEHNDFILNIHPLKSNDTENLPVCTGKEKLSDVENTFTDMSLMPIFSNVYKAVYAVAHTLHNLLDCTQTCATKKQPDPPTVPVSVCSESCPPGTRKAVQKGKPICCFDCIPCAEGEISNMTGTLITKRKHMTYCLYYSDHKIQLFFQHMLHGSNCIFLYFLLYKNTPIVKANNSELSFLLLFSLALCFLYRFVQRPLIDKVQNLSFSFSFFTLYLS